jgi:hypothetical protein
MNIENKFNQEIEKWKNELNKVSSINPANIGCEPYMNIYRLREDALPLIRELYEKGRQAKKSNKEKDAELDIIIYHGLPTLVKEISGNIGRDFEIPQDIKGKIDMIATYTKNWLDDYLK